MFSINGRKQLKQVNTTTNKRNNSIIRSPIISPIPPSDNLAKLTTSFEDIIHSPPPPPYDAKSTTAKKSPSLSSSTSESDPATKITRTTTTTTVTTVTKTTISAKNSPGQGPLYLDFGDFSLSPIEPNSNSDDSTSSQKKSGPLVTFDNNISVNDPSSITIVSSKTSTDPVKVQQVEEIPPASIISPNPPNPTSSTTKTMTTTTTTNDSQRTYPSLRPKLKGYQKVPNLENSDPNSRKQNHYLKRIESAPVMPNLSDVFDDPLISTKSMSNLNNLSNNLDSKNTVPLDKSSSETPKQYLERMQNTLSKSKLATMLAKKYILKFFF
jgi:hypothetical protein